ncbi:MULTISPECIES: ATP-binding protein [unclassified Pseudoalteromonas]|uniref:sensor histidine kinase n=1 Tax=unclassified Pseudoalteromonas TaxID=194690 RepID=UPI002097D719|nr:ATP-binding protein [Pseudoalteromonas sp. XMcav2-N]MCO7190411.1 ATP-binding protein [Pseudoalteromonas sp. XMcav2-N]
MNVRLHWSFAGQILLSTTLVLACALIALAIALHHQIPVIIASCSILLISLLTLLALLSRLTARRQRVLATLEDGIKSIKDGDLSLRISPTSDPELTSLIELYNQLTTNLKQQKQKLNQKELVLDSIVQASPMATLLLDKHRHIVYHNAAARQLLNKQAGALTGSTLETASDALPAPLAQALSLGYAGMLSFEQQEQKHTFYLGIEQVTLNYQPHTLVICKNVSAEQNREEIMLWKNAIRLISHELNNSLAPIQSLTSSAQTMLNQQKHLELLPDMLDTISQRAHNLSEFIQRYAEYARLPAPSSATHAIAPLLDRLQTFYPFTLLGTVPDYSGDFDLAQVEQVLLNLLKNAHESGSDKSEISVQVVRDQSRLRFAIVDRGCGIQPGNLHQALQPFYSTKSQGTGLGLSLCHDIITAHQGQLRLRNREKGGLMVEFDLPLGENGQ